MLKHTDQFYEQHKEPLKSCLHALRKIILSYDKHITEAWQYGMPFFYWQDKRICYIWIDKKTQQPYLGMVDGNKISHPSLIIENRKRMRIMRFDAAKDLPINTVHELLAMAITVVR